MNAVNYQKDLDSLIEKNATDRIVPKLMLHACCAVCSSYVLEYLSEYFSIYVVYYNPNITDKDEYLHRLNEEKRLIEQMPLLYEVTFIEGKYEPDVYLDWINGLENEKEGAKRCERCFSLRLSYAAKLAKAYDCDYFATTLTISPLKNARLINETGERIAQEFSVKYLPTDFKKKDGYKRSIELSNEYELYRQNYCGCVFSKNSVDKSKRI